MLKSKRSRVFIIAGIALLAMLLLSMGLSQVKLQVGESFSLDVSQNQDNQYPPLFRGDFFVYLFYAVYLVSMVVTFVLLIYMLLTPERRRRLARFLLRVVPVVVVLSLLLNAVSSFTRNSTQQIQVQPGIQITQAGTPAPLAVFTPATSPWIIFSTSLVLALVIAAVVVFIIVNLRRGTLQTTPLMRLADQAQATLDTLHAGGDLKNAVLRCYFEMSRILLEQRSLRRDRSMTPHEFEGLLVSKGLPAESVSLLTRLFEEVRYGTKEPGQREEWMAVTSLTAIIDACKGVQ